MASACTIIIIGITRISPLSGGATEAGQRCESVGKGRQEVFTAVATSDETSEAMFTAVATSDGEAGMVPRCLMTIATVAKIATVQS